MWVFPVDLRIFAWVEINVCERRLPDHTLPSPNLAPFRGVCRVSESKVPTPAQSPRPPGRTGVRPAPLLLPVPKTWWQRRPKAYRHPLAASQNRKFSVLAVLVVMLLHAYFLYELTRPVIPRFALPVEVLDDEPVEVEIDLSEASAAPAPPEAESAAQNAATSSAAQQEQAAASQAAQVPTPPTPISPPPPMPAETPPATASTAQAPMPVLANEQSAPAPQPLLSVEPVVAEAATQQPIVFEELAAAEAATDLPDEQAGAVGGNLPEATERVAAVRPLAAQAVVAPERIAAAPITLLPSISPPSVQNVPSAKAVLRPSAETALVPDLAIETEQPKLPNAPAPQAVVSVTEPLRVQPEVVRPQLEIERSKPELAPVGAPSSVAVPVQRVQREVQAARPSLEIQADKPVVSELPRVVVAARPDLRRQAAAERASRANATNVPAVDRDALTQIDTRGIRAPNEANAPSRSTGTASAQTGEPGGSQTSAQAGPSSANTNGAPGRIAGSAEGVDPFATGPGGRDLLSQAQQAASAQVGEQIRSTGDRRGAFRRYSDPFAEDYPSRLRGLRMREPQLFSDVSKFLVKTFGPAALGFALKASDEHYDFAGPDLGPLVENWIQQHHSDLKQECKRNAAEMSEQVRKLLCETGD